MRKKIMKKMCMIAALTLMMSTLAIASNAGEGDERVTSWKDLYGGMGIDTESGYDEVTSATKFTGYHTKDIPPLVNKVVDEEGNTVSLDGVTLSSVDEKKSVSLANGSFSYSSRYGKGEFVIVPDDTVEGYVWNDYFSKIYAATVSNGKNIAGALPWTDLYGESATSGPHYNKIQIAINNGTSVASNQAEVTRYAAFFDENGNVRAGSYTVTVYAEGYEALTAEIEVLETYTGSVEAGAPCTEADGISISGLPEDIENPTASVSYKVGEGRQAQTFYVAENADVNNSRVAVSSLEELEGTSLSMTVNSDNYAPVSIDGIVIEKHTPSLEGACEFCAENAGIFSDVKQGKYYVDAVKWAVKNNITAGTGNNVFSPDKSCSRSEIVTFLWRAAGCPEVTADKAFKDVASGSYYEKAVAWASANGITSGTGADSFAPNRSCSRAEVVTFLWRAAGCPEVTADKAFKDVASGSYYEKAVAWASANGITSGTGADSFAPDRSCSRAEIVTFMFRQPA